MRAAIGDDAVGAAVGAGVGAGAGVAGIDGTGALVVEGDFRPALEPLQGMTPMLSLVDDLDDVDAITMPAADAVAGAIDPDAAAAEGGTRVLRFPGGVGPRGASDAEIAARESLAADAVAERATVAAGIAAGATDSADAATGEQPVIVIDADEPLSSDSGVVIEPMQPRRANRASSVSVPRFFNLRRKGGKKDEGAATSTGSASGAAKGKAKGSKKDEGWFSAGPRDFTWDD